MKYGKQLAIISLSLALGLGLVGVTRSWFVSLSELPPGKVDSGLVRYFPEENRDVTALVTYGNLVSGRGIDQEGVPHILPGDRLQASSSVTVTGQNAVQTVETSIVRPFEAGETEGTVITRSVADFPKAGLVSRTQRDILTRSPPVETWLPSQPSTVPGPDTHEIVTTATTTTHDTPAATVTTMTTITTYTPLPGITGTTYTHKIVRAVTVTHEAAKFSSTDVTEANWPTGALRQETRETVLLAGSAGVPEKPGVPAVPAAPTKTSLHIRLFRPAGPGEVTTAPRSLPLALGNASTVPTSVRIGVTATMTRNGSATPETLAAKPGADGNWHFGKTTAGGAFIELLSLKPAVGTDYRWVPSGDSTAAWTLWDLTRTENAGDTTAIPPPPSPSPGVTAQPVRYKAVEMIQVAAKSAFGVPLTEFEQEFNALYCVGSPKIELAIHYYAKQQQYMDWSEFHVERLSLSPGGS